MTRIVVGFALLVFAFTPLCDPGVTGPLALLGIVLVAYGARARHRTRRVLRSGS